MCPCSYRRLVRSAEVSVYNWLHEISDSSLAGWLAGLACHSVSSSSARTVLGTLPTMGEMWGASSETFFLFAILLPLHGPRALWLLGSGATIYLDLCSHTAHCQWNQDASLNTLTSIPETASIWNISRQDERSLQYTVRSTVVEADNAGAKPF